MTVTGGVAVLLVGILLAALVVATALFPAAAAALSPVAVVAALVTAASAAFPRRLVAASAVALCAAGGLVVALGPGAALLVTLAASAGAAVWSARAPRAGTAAPALRPVLVAAAATVPLALIVAAWPRTTGVAVVVIAVVTLAWRGSPWALPAALALVGFEGSVKLLLDLDDAWLPAAPRATGAAAIDLALFAVVGGVVAADRLRTPRRLWSAANRLERAAIVALGIWLAISVLQIVQGGDVVRGLEGFRVFQSYVAVALVAAVVFAQPPLRRRGAQLMLAAGLAVGLYAAFRVLVGPAEAELEVVRTSETVTAYGGAIRAVGSFSSAVGMGSFLTPMTVFALVLGLLDPRMRRLGWTVAAVGLVGLVASYGRASIVGVALGLLVAVAVLALAADVSARRKLVAAGAVVAVLTGMYGGVQAASHASSQLRERAQGILDPLDDESVQLRFAGWEKRLGEIRDEPWGRGVGTVGHASAGEGRGPKTTDNSFLKVAMEQGIAVGLLFTLALLAAIWAIARRLRRLTGEARTLGVASLAGFVAFLGMATTGEYVEQPGKVVAWALLGIAAAQALGPATRGPETESDREG